MVVECISIILIILCTAFIFVRRKKKNHALAVLPLTIVPLLHFIAFCVLEYSFEVLKTNYSYILPAVDITALVLSCILIGLFAGSFSSKAAKRTYMIISGVFSVALVWIFISDTISKISV